MSEPIEYVGLPPALNPSITRVLIERGFLHALRDPSVVAIASCYGDPVELLESPP